MSNDGTMVRVGIDFTAWEFGFGVLNEEIAKTVTEVVAQQFKEDPPTLGFPFIWAPSDDGHKGPPVDDPTVIYLSVGAVGEEDSGPLWRFDLREIIMEDFVALVECGPGGVIDVVDHPKIERMRDSLRKIADELDAALHRKSGQ